MTRSCQQIRTGQTSSSEFILAKISKAGNYYFFAGSFTEVSTPHGKRLVGKTGMFPDDAHRYESQLTARAIANSLNRSGIGSAWHVVPASNPFQVPFAPIEDQGTRESAPPAA